MKNPKFQLPPKYWIYLSLAIVTIILSIVNIFICAAVMLKLDIPDKYAMERGGWSKNSTLKSVYQHIFSDEIKMVDEKIDGYFNNILGV